MHAESRAQSKHIRRQPACALRSPIHDAVGVVLEYYGRCVDSGPRGVEDSLGVLDDQVRQLKPGVRGEEHVWRCREDSVLALPINETPAPDGEHEMGRGGGGGERGED